MITKCFDKIKYLVDAISYHDKPAEIAYFLKDRNKSGRGGIKSNFKDRMRRSSRSKGLTLPAEMFGGSGFWL